MAVPYTFGTATSSIPLSQLDSNFSTAITLGNTAIQLGNTVTTLNNMTLANATISSGNVTLTNVSVTTANVTTGNVATLVTTSITNSGLTSGRVVYATTGGLETSSANLTFDGTYFGLGAAWTTNPMRSTQPQYFQYGAVSTALTIVSDGAATLQALRFTNSSASAAISFGKGRGTYAAPTAVASGDILGQITLQAYGGTTARTVAYIQGICETYTSDTDISSFLLFATSPSGSAAGTERMRITSAGNVGIGTSSPDASAILDAQSTTKGVRMPNMTTTQKNAISSPAAGLMVFDTTLAKLCVYSGAAWQTITSI